MADAAVITASAPGSLMLLGEHAVLHGHQALVCAINRRITLRLVPSDTGEVNIVSALGTYRSPLDDLVDHPSFRFVIAAIRRHTDRLPGGFDMRIDSEFTADIGFGSSAAVTVSAHAALMHWITGKPPVPGQLFAESLETVQTVQGRGSGADVAAAVFGGIVRYRMPAEIRPLHLSIPLTAVYCGYKMPTPEVIRTVEALRTAQPDRYDRLFTDIDRDIDRAVAALEKRDFPAFGGILNRNQRYMDAMGVNTPELEAIVCALQAEPEIFGAKISGAGLGDCAVGIGYADLTGLGYPVHHLEITPAGCRFHE
jgi:mevalonate kinase